MCDQLGYMLPPALQCVLALLQKVIPLIDSRYTRDGPRLMVEDLIGDMRRDAQAGHTRDACSPEVMKAPACDARQGVELPLIGAEILKARHCV